MNRQDCLDYGYAVLKGTAKIEDSTALLQKINNDIDSLWWKDLWDSRDNELYRVASRVREVLKEKVAG